MRRFRAIAMLVCVVMLGVTAGLWVRSSFFCADSLSLKRGQMYRKGEDPRSPRTATWTERLYAVTSVSGRVMLGVASTTHIDHSEDTYVRHSTTRWLPEPGIPNDLVDDDSLPPGVLGFGVYESSWAGYTGRGIMFPMWALCLVFLAGSLLLARDTPGRRRRRGHCPACGYDLRGAFDAGCPECGWNRAEARGDAGP